MMSEESRELCKLRQDQEAAAAFEAGKHRSTYRSKYWQDPARIEEKDPRDRD